MTYTLPLVDQTGRCYGVFGIELSVAYMQSQLPATEIPFANGVYVLCRRSNIKNGPLDRSLFTGAYGDILTHNSTTISINESSEQGLYDVSMDNGMSMYGVLREISPYGASDYYAGDDWVLLGLVPKLQLHVMAQQNHNTLILVLLLCIACSGIGMAIIGKKSTEPIVKFSQDIQKMQDGEAICQTNIVELDELVALFSARPVAGAQELPPDLFNEFIERTKSLTYTERIIFEHYMEGMTPKEIVETMFMSINTLKVHNKHIYQKLNISSRDELLLYIQLLKKSNKLSEIK